MFTSSFGYSEMVENILSNDVAVIHWITLCHKNRMTTRVITLWQVSVMSFTASVSIMSFLIEIMFILKATSLAFKKA